MNHEEESSVLLPRGTSGEESIIEADDSARSLVVSVR